VGDDSGFYTRSAPHRGGSVPEASVCPWSGVADTIMRTIELGMTITDAAVDEKQTTIFCSPVTHDPRCRPAVVMDGTATP
jgi:hypothetical protein